MNKIDMVYRILSGPPIDILEEDSNIVFESNIWELVQARATGDHAGSRKIGAANLVTAYNFVLTINSEAKNSIPAMQVFSEILCELSNNKLIRQIPDLVRTTFKAV